MKKSILVLALALGACRTPPPAPPGVDPFAARVGAAIVTIPENREPLVVDAIVPTKPEHTEPIGL